MRQRLQFWVLGGDPRQSALAEALAEDGHSVYTYALEQSSSAALAAPGLEPITGADCVVLPLPTADGELLNAPLADAPLPLAQLLDALRRLSRQRGAVQPVKEVRSQTSLTGCIFFGTL